MTTAAAYRRYAKECVESAWSATSDSVRKQFLEIAKLRMMAAVKMDTGAVHATSREGLGRADRPLPNPKRRSP